MAAEYSFDIISKYDLSKIINATEQAQREINNRYDFAGTDSSIAFDKDKHLIVINSDSKLKVEAAVTVLEQKMVKAGLDLRLIDKGTEAKEMGLGRVKQDISLINGLSSDRAKEVSAWIRNNFSKAKSSINADKVRVSSPSKDVLQEIISRIKSASFDYPLDIENLR
jgi:uncharacterized protein YajQ (UPF0234 family)